MAKRIRTLLVPLDGSSAAEGALAYGLAFARGMSAEIVLLRAALAQTAPGAAAASAQREVTRVILEAESYLAGVERRLQAQGVNCRAVVPYGPPAASIIDNAELQNADLVVMSSHGRSGAGHWDYGGVADKVVQGLGVPVLLTQGQSAVSEGMRVLVPLDSSELAEAILEPISDLATCLGCGVTLLTVMTESEPRCLGGTVLGCSAQSRVGHSCSGESVKSYLDRTAVQLRKTGLDVRTEVLEGNPAEEILEVASHGASLVAVSAHGLSGVGRWVYGSVAAQVTHEASCPVLLYRPSGARLRIVQPTLVRRCHNCGRQVHREAVSTTDLCPLCGFPLRVCANCAHFDGVVCEMENPWNGGIYADNPCSDFEFRETCPAGARSHCQ